MIMDKETTVFVKLDDYKDVVDIMTLTRDKIEHLKTVLNRLEETNSRENEQLEQWKSMVSDVEKSLQEIEGKLQQ